jgi:GT2 family glycosyltransferase
MSARHCIADDGPDRGSASDTHRQRSNPMKLPAPPSLAELRAHTPAIGAVPGGTPRPFWSVMIPTYNNGHYLRRTLESVLSQDLGPDRMQIEVVDGCSTKDDPEAIVQELGKGRVTFHRLSANRGPAHTFNVSIERSRGHWVHVLHGDDMVLPGFYEAYTAAIHAYPRARTVLGQAIVIDEDDRWTGLFGPVPPVGGGILENFAVSQATRQLVLFPGVVVRRDAYEEVGGFCTWFNHVADWDMWFRLGQHAPVAYMARPFAQYRSHGETDTNRQKVSALNIRECYFVVTANLVRLQGSAPASQGQPWRSQLAAYAEKTAWELDSQNCAEGRYNQARWAWLLEPNRRRLVMLMKSWVKYRLVVTRPAAIQ